MAEVDRLSTSVSIRHTYLPPWLSWMLRIIRSPETLYKQKNIHFDELLHHFGFWFFDMNHIWCFTQSSLGLTFPFLQQKQTWQMSSEQNNLLAALQAPPAARPPPPTQHKQPPALQDTKDKHSLVNWQDNPNYSLITQAQTRERMSKIPSKAEQILW